MYRKLQSNDLGGEKMVGHHVLYNGKIFTIIFSYDTGYCEIRDTSNFYNVELVHHSQLIKLKRG